MPESSVCVGYRRLDGPETRKVPLAVLAPAPVARHASRPPHWRPRAAEGIVWGYGCWLGWAFGLVPSVTLTVFVAPPRFRVSVTV